jgi:hypothetical protein
VSRRQLHLDLSAEKVSGKPLGGGTLMLRERRLSEMLSIADWRRFAPESAALLAVIWAARAYVLGDAAAPETAPHPFWMAVMLMSAQYGVMGGLFATVLATGSFFITGLPAQSASQDFYAYAAVLAAQPCAWFGIALLLGGLRTLHIHHQTELEEQLEEARLMAEHLGEGLERALEEVARLEKRIAIDTGTLASFDEAVRRLTLRDRSTLVTSITELIRHAVRATSFSIYLEGARGLEPAGGIENGAPLAAAAIGALPPSMLDEMRGSAASHGRPAAGSAHARYLPFWSPIRVVDSAELLGVVVCTRLQRSQDPAVAARRLDGLCHMLALLLSARPEPVS